jgi:hypothetical protein
MSIWRIAVKALHEIGGEADTAAVADFTLSDPYNGLRIAKEFGLVEQTAGGRGGSRRLAKWRITAKGTALCEGRLGAYQLEHGRWRFAATWLASLPRGIRIPQQETPCAA